MVYTFVRLRDSIAALEQNRSNTVGRVACSRRVPVSVRREDDILPYSGTEIVDMLLITALQRSFPSERGSQEGYGGRSKPLPYGVCGSFFVL